MDLAFGRSDILAACPTVARFRLIAHRSLHIAHCTLHIGHFATDLARLRSLQGDPLLDESIELLQMLGSSLKTLPTRSDLAPTGAQCAIGNVPCIA